MHHAAARTALCLILATLLAAAAAAGGIDVNRASQAELEQVSGVGVALGERLLAERARRPFDDWADLLRRVPGIGPASARRLSAAGLRVNDLPYAAPADGVQP